MWTRNPNCPSAIAFGKSYTCHPGSAQNKWTYLYKIYIPNVTQGQKMGGRVVITILKFNLTGFIHWPIHISKFKKKKSTISQFYKYCLYITVTKTNQLLHEILHKPIFNIKYENITIYKKVPTSKYGKLFTQINRWTYVLGGRPTLDCLFVGFQKRTLFFPAFPEVFNKLVGWLAFMTYQPS